MSRALKLFFDNATPPTLRKTELVHENLSGDSPLHFHGPALMRGQKAVATFLVKACLSELARVEKTSANRDFEVAGMGNDTSLVRTLWNLIIDRSVWFQEMFGNVELFERHGTERRNWKIRLNSAVLHPQWIHIIRQDSGNPDVPIKDAAALKRLLDQLHEDFRKGDDARRPDGPLPSDSENAKCFLRRETATPEMCRDMKHFEKLVFLGVSQQKLRGYLQDILDKLEGQERLRWKSIEIYYADDNIGKQLESEFIENVRRSRQDIASFLIQEIDRIPDLEEVIFRQAKSARVETGCMMGNFHGSEPRFETMYVVSGLLPDETENRLTFKIGDVEEHRRSNPFSQTLGEVYQSIRKSSRSLGVFRRSLWDQSVEEWCSYCEASSVQQQGMEEFVKFAGIQPNENVLELAAGSGYLSQRLASQISRYGSLTILEASPVMLESAKRKLSSSEKVQFSLYRLLSDHKEEFEDIDIHQKVFDVIVMHLSLFNVAAGAPALHEFAKWCRLHLKPQGRLILSAQNTVLGIKTKPEFNIDEDPLRLKLKELAKENGWKLLARQPSLAEDNVERAFKGERFSIVKSAKLDMDNPIADRLAMWRVPAILGTFLDISHISSRKIDDVMESLKSELTETKPYGRTIRYWEFKLKLDTGAPG